ncbi:hypothetical protein QBL02_10490 [Leucobacter sp. UT-8R-CII-1-4]|uniref:hypothetical protein n=1 Tax=Leucobacter sp. UT-8R-CII-1-4 TaxID=3040075 RepID=UPI0024A97978|nr:hypothetical protein [Leucobacter sp. UT-8R-CII-1-4]MDI6023971.1 hypothetical protein [Leucobacter sp. UT-8R-CII-1-4]
MFAAVQFASVLAEAAESEQFDPNKVTPGVGGFLVIALLAIALFFLGFDMVRRLRRSKYRAEIQEELAAEIAERDAAAQASAQGETDPRPDSQA